MKCTFYSQNEKTFFNEKSRGKIRLATSQRNLKVRMTFLYLPVKSNNCWGFWFGLVLSLSEENDLSYE